MTSSRKDFGSYVAPSLTSEQRAKLETVSKHFVTFFSPGTFLAETTTKAIDSWDVDTAVDMAAKIVERYGARPYGFSFSTRSRGPDDLDSEVSAKSRMYFLGGRVVTIDEVRTWDREKNRILLSNMQSNGWDRIVVNDNSWRATQPLEDGDVVLDVTLPPLPA